MNEDRNDGGLFSAFILMLLIVSLMGCAFSCRMGELDQRIEKLEQRETE